MRMGERYGFQAPGLKFFMVVSQVMGVALAIH